MNLFGTMERIELALGRHPQAIGRELVETLQRLNPPSLKALWESRRVRRAGAATCGRGSCRSAPVRRSWRRRGSPPCPMSRAGPATAGASSPSVPPSPRTPQRPAQLRSLPAADLRRRDDRHALAEHEGRARASLRGRARGSAAGGRGGAGRRSDPDARGDPAAAGGHGRARLRRVPARRRDRLVPGTIDRPSGCPANAEFILEGVVPAGRAPARRPVRRSFRSLLRGRRLPGVPPPPGHPPARSRSIPPRWSASRRRRTRHGRSRWARWSDR